eukprot:CAMPEP_0117591348 /NCGR_PEP_ID=MMETSP0784-20121206/71481_1 /TAXON_ID=39447 /ORGANISM="" /LENGTH=327 /DNA_ID=CAMNT_0005393057 /DNA_START=122 /DNA_END=1105 /DNA_ORIENTATION=-
MVFARCQRRFRGQAAVDSDLDEHEFTPRFRSDSLGSDLSEHAVVTVPPTGDDCAICLATITEDCIRTRCGHHFHQGCFDEYLTKSHPQIPGQRCRNRARCPVCRQSVHAPFPVEATAASGRRIEVMEAPSPGDLCHFDRGYIFRSLGSFRGPGMLYVHTSNEDRRTPSTSVMWILETRVQVIVYLNFRSDDHVARTGSWLRNTGWSRDTSKQSTVSTGVPNGPYAGPVFSKEFEPGRIELMGSNTWEGVYFVFVELVLPTQAPAGARVPTGPRVAAPAEAEEGVTASAEQGPVEAPPVEPGVSVVASHSMRRVSARHSDQGEDVEMT